MTYRIPDPMPWALLSGPLVAAEDALARLDARLTTTAIHAGFGARTHFTDACASLWLDGELVHLEDLVLHDAGMDIRAPTHELTQSHAVLRSRRRIAAAPPGWALSPTGLEALRGRPSDRQGEGHAHPDATQQGWAPPGWAEQGRAAHGRAQRPKPGDELDEDETDGDEIAGNEDGDTATPDAPQELASNDLLAVELASIDAAVARSARTLAIGPRPTERRDAFLYDLDWDEDGRLDDWQRIVDHTKTLPPTLAAAIALEAWSELEPLQHLPWLGRLLAPALLRARSKTRAHLTCLSVGLRATPRERRRAQDPTTRLLAVLEAMSAAADAGRQEHDRWLATRTLLERKLFGRRSTSRLPALIEYVMTRPIVSAGMIAAALGITPRAAQSLVAELGLREATGRGRYRAWGVL